MIPDGERLSLVECRKTNHWLVLLSKQKPVHPAEKEGLDDTFEPWNVKKSGILSKFTTSEKLSITTSFLSAGNSQEKDKGRSDWLSFSGSVGCVVPCFVSRKCNLSPRCRLTESPGSNGRKGEESSGTARRL